MGGGPGRHLGEDSTKMPRFCVSVCAHVHVSLFDQDENEKKKNVRSGNIAEVQQEIKIHSKYFK